MRKFILRVIIYAVGIALVAEIVPGIHIQNDALSTLIIIGVVFGILNAIPNQNRMAKPSRNPHRVLVVGSR